MTTSLIRPKPDNLSVVARNAPPFVEGDMYHICERIKEIDPNLRVVLHDKHPKPFVVMENCRDGVERFVARYEVLDARILDDLRYMLAVPFEKRIAAEEAKNEAHNAQSTIPDEKIEELAWDFQKAMVKDNMSTPKWGKTFMYNPRKR